MRAALTGASGLLGGNLARELCGRGYTVVATRRAGSGVAHLDDQPIHWMEADLGDVDALTRAFTGADVVFHVAAQVSVRRTPNAAIIAANVTGTENVLAAVRRVGARLVHTSTVSAVGVSEDGRPCDEHSRFNFADHGLLDAYVQTKHAAEERVRAATDVDAVIVNPTFMLGPYDSKPSSGQLLVALAKGRLPGNTPGTNNFVDVRDVARGMLLAAERGMRGERYILGGENLTYAEAFRRFAAVLGVRPPARSVPHLLARVGGWAGDLRERLTDAEPELNSATVAWGYCDRYLFTSARAEAELGYTHGPIEPAVADAAAWFRARGLL